MLAIGCEMLILLGYLILNPHLVGMCVQYEYPTECFSESVYYGIGYTFKHSLYPYLAILFILSFVPTKYLYYWFRLVLPLMALVFIVAYGASPLRQNMFDMSRSDVVYEAGMYLLVLTVVVVGFSYVKLEVERRFRGKK